MGWRSRSVRPTRAAVLVVALLAGTGPPGSGSATAPVDDVPPPSTGAVAPAGPVVAPRARWGWPLQPVPAVARQFEAPPSPWSAGHRGVDLGSSQGAAVLAPADGVVTFAGVVVDRGVLVLAHAGGLRTSYEPVTATVLPGDPVVAGQQVATVGPQPGHCPPDACLHWGLRRGSTYLDPLRMVRGAAPPVLLPLEPPGQPPPRPPTGRSREADQPGQGRTRAPPARAQAWCAASCAW